MGKIEIFRTDEKSERVLFVSAAQAPQAARELLAGGLRPDTPVALLVKAPQVNASDTDLAGYGAAWFR
ncbi:MAG TPA: hypothetical protein VFP70_03380 [Burkholderiales bacterium]|nr:hypothetical protein [Burkholderiales bacterium]